mgnify:CR=1 FL=1
MNSLQSKKVLEHLFSFITEHKKNKMMQVLEHRTRHVTVVLENLFQSHNASAVLRSCDIFGVQDMHVVENKNTFKVASGVAMGASKWLNVHRYSDVATAMQKLKKDGYRIIATVPRHDAVPIQSLNIDTKMALFFGAEYTGLSSQVLEHADEAVVIPMFGFTESFNISVSVALCLQEVIGRLHSSQIKWRLNELERQDLLLQWARKVLRNADALEKQLD